MSATLTRPEKAARKVAEKAYGSSLKAASKDLGCGYSKPDCFKRVGEWFLCVHPVIWTDERKAEAWALVKPFAIDDLISQMLGFGGVGALPLSAHARGPYCLVRPMFLASIERGGNVEAMTEATAQFIVEADDRVSRIDIDDFIRFSHADRPAGVVSDNEVAALVLAGRCDEALALCQTAVAATQKGSHSRLQEDGSLIGFFELAERWIGQNA